MKNYLKPTVSVVELQAKESLAANPFGVTSVEMDGVMTTTYSLATFNPASGEFDDSKLQIFKSE